MSEQPNSIGIEDVLTSIRRLVSEDMRPAGREARITMRKQAAQMDKLILTPALRVEGAESEAADSGGDSSATDETPQDRHFEAVVVDLSAHKANSGLSDPMQHTLADAVKNPEVVEAVNAVLHGQPAPATPIDVIEDAVLVVDESVTVPILPEEVQMELVPDVPTQDDTVREDGIPAEMQPFAFADVQSLIRDEVLILSREFPGYDASDRPESGLLALEELAVPQFRTARIDAGQTLMAANLDHPLPAEPLPAEPLSVPEMATPDGMTEAALRDMVHQILLQELQGTLGERITANVRKLVRAEINRVLSTKGLT